MNGGDHEPREPGHGPDNSEDLLERAFPKAWDEQVAQPVYDQGDEEVLAARPVPPGERPPDEREADEERPSPRIYVASLSDYNAGRLHGRWIDANQPLDDLWSDIGDMLAESPEPGAEEWAIHDYEGFWPLELSEYESLEFVREVASGIAAHGEAFAAFVEMAERDPERFSFFEQMYRGRWESLIHYAEALLEHLDAEGELARLPEWLRNNVLVHVEGFADELEANGSVMTVNASDGGVYVFDFE